MVDHVNTTNSVCVCSRGAILNQSNDMIVHECWTENKYTNRPMLHTDFFAFRPNAVDRERLLQADRRHAESHFTKGFRHIYDAGRFAYVEGASHPIRGKCRIEGVDSPVVHVHELSRSCPSYYNISKGYFYG